MPRLPRRQSQPQPSVPANSDAAPPAEVVPAEVLPQPVRNGAHDVLDALESIMRSVRTGSALQDSDGIARLMHEQEKRAEVISSLLMTHDQDRLLQVLRTRKKLEDELHEQMAANLLAPSDKIMFLNYLNNEAKHLEANVKAGSCNLKDVVGALIKLDYAMQQGDTNLRNKLAATSPQAREVVRKLAYRVARSARPAQTDEVIDGE